MEGSVCQNLGPWTPKSVWPPPLLLHLSKDALILFAATTSCCVLVIVVRFSIAVFVHVDIMAVCVSVTPVSTLLRRGLDGASGEGVSAMAKEFGWQRRDRWDIRKKHDRTGLGSTIAAAEKANSCCQVCLIFIIIRSPRGRWPVIGAPLAVVGDIWTAARAVI